MNFSRRHAGGHTNVVCYGAAHLVRVQEDVLAEPLQTTMKSFAPNTPAFAVEPSDTSMYKPLGSQSGYLPAFAQMRLDMNNPYVAALL